MNCEQCGVALDYPYHLARCPGCYAKIASTAPRPEIEESNSSRAYSLWSLGLLFIGLRMGSWARSPLLDLTILFAAFGLAALAINFHLAARSKVLRMEVPTHRFTRAGLVLGLIGILYSLILIAVLTRNFSRLPV